MHLKILACDLDGTLTDSHHVAPEVWKTLREAKATGFRIFFVTGRLLENFVFDGPFKEIAEAIVAENGALVYFPQSESIILPFGKLATALEHKIESLGVPLERGRAILATNTPHDKPILDTIREMGGGAAVEYNRGAVMVLPPGASKGTGVQYALRELGYSARNLVSFGDAENDISLFESAELGVAVANASTNVQRVADVVTTQRNGHGVQEAIGELVAGRVPKRRHRTERRLALGEKLSGPNVQIDPFLLLDNNLAVLGKSSSGKSWLAGLLAEQLLALGYQICVIDPEGDYRNLRAVGHTLILGGTDSPLPPVVDVITLAEYSDVSLILDLSAYPLDQERRYVNELLHGLMALREQRGRPHWFLFDEIQNLCPQGADCELSASLREAMRQGGVALVSFRPSQVSRSLLAAIDCWLLTRLDEPVELETLREFAGNERFQKVLRELPELPSGHARLLAPREIGHDPTLGPEVMEFRTTERKVLHVRHVHKYLRVPLPQDRRFYFRNHEGEAIDQASSLWHFAERLEHQPSETIVRHLKHGDFERWTRDVLRDPTLADNIRRLRKRQLDAESARRALSKVVRKRYEELETLA